MDTDDLIAEVKQLREKVETLERRTNDFGLKSQIVGSQLSGLGQSGLDRFFAEPEFWENTYDSAQADCSRRCIEDLMRDKQVCEQIADPAGRQACVQEALDRAVACHAACA